MSQKKVHAVIFVSKNAVDLICQLITMNMFLLLVSNCVYRISLYDPTSVVQCSLQVCRLTLLSNMTEENMQIHIH